MMKGDMHLFAYFQAFVGIDKELISESCMVTTQVYYQNFTAFLQAHLLLILY